MIETQTQTQKDAEHTEHIPEADKMLEIEKKTRRLRVYGIVQGVGFRPTVSRHAASSGVTGTVCNRGPFVEIYIQGTEEMLNSFEKLLREQPPKRAAILKIDSRELENSDIFQSFEIIESAKTKGEIFISPDIATCDTCREELFDKKDRRYRHPFINCTCCGPRLTILDALPYDRERTSMKEFPMCPECSEEYYSPATRRYDAQPVCCNECGPEVYLLPKEVTEPSISNEELEKRGICHGLDAIRRARQTIVDGGIVAIKGIGGYHLCCDATNEEAVMLLRNRKRRPMKPFAVMMRDMDTVMRECLVEEAEAKRDLLTGHQKPILLLPRSEKSHLAPSVAPGNPKVGVMLPYAPVQMLLFELPEDDGDQLVMPDCLVMTSGNVSGAPICRDDLDAVKELGHLSDEILSHNRMIRIRADDSVMDFYDGKPYMIRRSRGFAPLPFLTKMEKQGCVLAIGGELKNTFCLGVNGMFYPSPYVGDLADLRTVKALQETIDRFQTLLEVEPQTVVCDLHPNYNSTFVAEQIGKPTLKIQHHYAHILSCMAENDFLDPVIGVSFDGTGFGTDGSIWGGEILLADLHGFERAAHIKPFLQLGGDASSKEGWRIAVSMIYSLTGDKEKAREIITKLGLCGEKELKMQFLMADRRINAVPSTSAGRLFDAVSAILDICKASTFEGEAATSLQFAAESYLKEHPEEKEAFINQQKMALCACGEMDENPISEGSAKALTEVKQNDQTVECQVLATDLLVEKLVKAKLDGEKSSKLAWIFHKELAKLIAEGCRKVREQSGRNTVALSGGCYQNVLLLDLTRKLLEADDFTVLMHSMIPPNDGGIAIGQALYGLANLEKQKVR